VLVGPQDDRTGAAGTDVGDHGVEHLGIEGRSQIGAGVALEHQRIDERDDAWPCGHPPLLAPSA
jgi:hypothetical protein